MGYVLIKYYSSDHLLNSQHHILLLTNHHQFEIETPLWPNFPQEWGKFVQGWGKFGHLIIVMIETIANSILDVLFNELMTVTRISETYL